jgi:hypothetical protein
MCRPIFLIDFETDRRLFLERLLKEYFPQEPLVVFEVCRCIEPAFGLRRIKVVVPNGRANIMHYWEFASSLHKEMNIPVVLAPLRHALHSTALNSGAVVFVEPGPRSTIQEAIGLFLG